MKIYTKILLITFPLVLVSVLASSGLTYHLSKTALTNLAQKWLEARLPDAVQSVDNIQGTRSHSSASPGLSNQRVTQEQAIQALINFKFGHNGFAMVVDDRGNILAYPEANLIGMNIEQESWFQKMKQNGDNLKAANGFGYGKIAYTWQGESYLGVYDFYEPWNWYIIVADPYSEVYGATSQAGFTSLLFAIASLSIIALLLMIMTRRLTSPIRLLEEGAAQVGQGKLDIRIPVKTKDELGNLANVFNQMASQLQVSVEIMKSNEAVFRALIENSTDFIQVLKQDGTITYSSPSITRSLGYIPEELFGTNVFDLIHPEDTGVARSSFSSLIEREGSLAPIQLRVRRKDDGYIAVECNGSNLLHEPTVAGLVINSRDIGERQQAERLQDAIYRISEAAHRAHNLEELFPALHSIIRELMPANNFYVALLNEASRYLEFPYYVDEYDVTPAPYPLGKGLTEYVLRTGEPQLIPPERFEQLVISGEVDDVGAPSIDWVGVPLRIGEKTLGVMVTQSYTESVRFGEKEKDILVFVSEQAAMSIARKQAEDAMRVNEMHYHDLFENSPVSLWEEDFSDIHAYIEQLRLKGVSDFQTYFTSHPEEIQECIRRVKVLDVNQATLKLFEASCKEEFLNNLGHAMGKETADVMLSELLAIADYNKEFEGTGVYYKLDGTKVDIIIRWSVPPSYENDLSRIVVSIVDVSERKQAEEQARNQLQRLNALRAIDASITASLDLKATLNVLLDQVTNQLKVDAAEVLLLDPHILRLGYAAGRGFRTTALQHTHLRLGEGYAGRAALERHLLKVDNLMEAPGELGNAPLLSEEGFVAYYAMPLVAKGQVKGVLEIFHRSLLNPSQEWLDFLETLGGQAAIAVDNATLFNDLQRSNVELTLAYDATIEGWSRALDMRDKETEGHTLRVTEMTLKLAQLLGVSNASTVHLRWGALLHDIGKMGIPDSILLKPGPLTNAERTIMRRHPIYAYEMLLPIAYLRPALDIPYYHHEKWDGTGYPCKLSGEGIPLAARIFSIIDVYDALRSDRPYRSAWSDAHILKYIHEQSGKHFDPRVTSAFLNMIGE